MIGNMNEWLWVTDTWRLAQGGVTSQTTHAPLSSFVTVVSTVSLTEVIYRHTFPILICTIQATGHDQRNHTQWKSPSGSSLLLPGQRDGCSLGGSLCSGHPWLAGCAPTPAPRVLATLILRITGFNLHHSISKSKIDLGIIQFSLLIFQIRNTLVLPQFCQVFIMRCQPRPITSVGPSLSHQGCWVLHIPQVCVLALLPFTLHFKATSCCSLT